MDWRGRALHSEGARLFTAQKLCRMQRPFAGSAAHAGARTAGLGMERVRHGYPQTSLYEEMHVERCTPHVKLDTWHMALFVQGSSVIRMLVTATVPGMRVRLSCRNDRRTGVLPLTL